MLSLLLALSLSVQSSPSGTARMNANTSAPVQVFIPGSLVAGAGGSPSTVKVKGLETPGRSLSTEICKVRYTVSDRQGKALMVYPGNQTACAQVLLSINTTRGVWKELPLDLERIRKARLVQGTYLFSVQIYLGETKNGRRQDLPAVVSNTATLRVK